MALGPAHVVQGAAASPGGLLETSISASVCIRTCVFNKTLQVTCMVTLQSPSLRKPHTDD